MAKTAMENLELQWNLKKCNVLHARHGVVSETSNGSLMVRLQSTV